MLGGPKTRRLEGSYVSTTQDTAGALKVGQFRDEAVTSRRARRCIGHPVHRSSYHSRRGNRIQRDVSAGVVVVGASRESMTYRVCATLEGPQREFQYMFATRLADGQGGWK